MKIKRLFSILGLALFGFASAGAGLLASPKKAAEPVKATEGDWMFRIQFNLGAASNWETPAENIRFHCWGTNLDETYPMGRSGVNYNKDAYGVNVVLNSTQTVSGGQFILQQGGETKYSVNLDNCTFTSGGSTFVRHYTFYNGDWTQDGDIWKFNTTANNTASAPIFKMTSNSNVSFVANPAKNRWELKNYSFTAVEGKDITARYWQVNLGQDYSKSNVQSTSQKYVPNGSDSAGSWADLASYGTYDFFLTNETIGNGQLAIRKHSASESSYIYYVLENNTPTNDYIYSWDGSEQFGEYPGTKVTEVAGVQEVTGTGVLHFEGSETPKLIYKIPVTIGYPSGDEFFLFDNNAEWKSPNAEIVAGAAYWYTAIANPEAGSAIDFLVAAEAKRNAATNTSVCNISVSDATTIVNSYNALTASVREYIDASTVYTHKRDKTSGNELVSYRAVIEELAAKAHIAVVGGSRLTSEFNFATGSSNITIIIVSVVALCSTTFIALILIKKRKHQ